MLSRHGLSPHGLSACGSRRLRRKADKAYVLPLAAAAAGLLLLMSLMLQSLALRERLQVSLVERQRREEDLLASAAHQLLAALNDSHRCLLGLPLARWEVEGLACASPGALAALRQTQVWAAPVRLLAWQPGANGLAAELELELMASAENGTRRRRFDTRILGSPPLAVDPRPHTLGGPQP